MEYQPVAGLGKGRGKEKGSEGRGMEGKEGKGRKGRRGEGKGEEGRAHECGLATGLHTKL